MSSSPPTTVADLRQATDDLSREIESSSNFVAQTELDAEYVQNNYAVSLLQVSLLLVANVVALVTRRLDFYVYLFIGGVLVMGANYTLAQRMSKVHAAIESLDEYQTYLQKSVTLVQKALQDLNLTSGIGFESARILLTRAQTRQMRIDLAKQDCVKFTRYRHFESVYTGAWLVSVTHGLVGLGIFLTRWSVTALRG